MLTTSCLQNTSQKFKKIKNDKAQIVIGKRNQFNRYTEKLISMIFKNLFDVDDPLSGLKIYKKSFKKIY